MYHKRHKFTEGINIFYLEQNYEENSISKLKQKGKSDKQIDLMGMKQEGLLFLHKVMGEGGGRGNALHA